MSEATIFEYPYNLFLKQRMEFVVICGDHLAANVMRVVEADMIKRKEAWQVRVEQALEAKKEPPKEPKTWWVRLSQAQIIARLYMYDSAKLKKPESEDLNSPEWVEYRFKKALSISKATLKKAIELLKALGFLIERSKPGDEFGAPIYTLDKENVQNAIKKLPANPFAIFHALGGVENSDSGGDSRNFHVPPKNSDSGESKNLTVPPQEFSPGDSKNFHVDIDITIDPPEDTGIDTEEEGTYSANESESATNGADAPAHAPDSDEPYRPDFSANQDRTGDANVQPHVPNHRRAASGPASGMDDRSGDIHNHNDSDASFAPTREAENQDAGQTTPAVVPSQQFSTGFPLGGKVTHARSSKPASEQKPKRTRTKAAPVVPEFTPEGRKVYDAWCSLFKSPPRVGPKTVECADALYPLLVPWCKELKLSCKDLLNEIKNQMYATDTNGFYKRGITLCDVERDFERWQSAKTQELERAKSAKSSVPTTPDGPVNFTQRRLEAQRAAKQGVSHG